MKYARLIECINWSWSGEGISRGTKCLILRFKRCNKNCIFCDTQIKMKVMQEAEYSFTDLQTMIDDNYLQVMITGGEPTFSNNLLSTIDLINKLEAHKFEVETNGCQLEELINKVNHKKHITYVLSPKLFTDEDMEFYKKLVINIKDNDKVIIKLVCEDRDYIIKFLKYLKEVEFNTNRLWLMPEGKTREELIGNAPFVFDMCEKYSANFSSRDHVIYNFI